MKLGMIGMSEGNGHPYSWSAIVNGDFDRAAMKECGFAGIPLYLEANSKTLGIDGAEVTHIWTQDPKLSAHIAQASGISKVALRMEDMIGQVDAVILARDDPENHVAMAKPFIEADIPIFIDKPLAITTDDLDYFTGEIEAGKRIMSCSSMRYSLECGEAKAELPSLGKIELLTVVGKKDWIKYGIHMLEAMVALLDDPLVASVRHVSESGRDIVLVKFDNGLLSTVHLFRDIAPTFQLSLFGRYDWRLVEIKDSYRMFKETLYEFIRSVREGKAGLPFEKTANIIRALIGAKDSLENGGKTVHLK